MTITATTAQQMFTAHIESQTTDQLFAILDVMEAKAKRTPDERMIKASVSDAIEARHNLEAAMDKIYMDDNFEGTYTDALRIAYNQK